MQKDDDEMKDVGNQKKQTIEERLEGILEWIKNLNKLHNKILNRIDQRNKIEDDKRNLDILLIDYDIIGSRKRIIKHNLRELIEELKKEIQESAKNNNAKNNKFFTNSIKDIESSYEKLSNGHNIVLEKFNKLKSDNTLRNKKTNSSKITSMENKLKMQIELRDLIDFIEMLQVSNNKALNILNEAYKINDKKQKNKEILRIEEHIINPRTFIIFENIPESIKRLKKQIDKFGSNNKFFTKFFTNSIKDIESSYEKLSNGHNIVLEKFNKLKSDNTLRNKKTAFLKKIENLSNTIVNNAINISNKLIKKNTIVSNAINISNKLIKKNTIVSNTIRILKKLITKDRKKQYDCYEKIP